MRVTQISVELEKRVSDGDYGSERSQATLTAWIEPTEDSLECLDQLMAQARVQVEADLRASKNLKVRRAVNPERRLCSECKRPLADSEDYEHEACGEIRKERRAREEEERRERYRLEREERQRELEKLPVAVGLAEDEDDEKSPF